MATALDTRRIRRSTHAPSQLRDYYQEYVQHTSVETGTASILDAIERSSVSPRCFAPWLGVTKSPFAIKHGLLQNFSVIVREFSVRHLGKALRSSRWKETWDGIGGSEGLLHIFSELSVNEVRLACKLLGKSGIHHDERQECITELFVGLQPQIFPDAPYKTEDKRPLGKFYRHLIPSCTEEVVERIVSGDLKEKWKPARDDFLMRYHPGVMQREQLRMLTQKTRSATDYKRFTALVTQFPKAMAGDKTAEFSRSMMFALQVLRRVVSEKDLNIDGDVLINDLARPLLRRTIRKKVPWLQILEIVDLIMLYLDANPYVGKEITLTDGDVRHLVAQCWARKPDMFETHLRKLCSDPTLGTTSRNDPSEWEDFLVQIPIKRRYALFQLCFYESTGLDVDKEDDLIKVKGAFSNELFEKLTAQQALDLFVRLRAAKGDKTHISIWIHDSIFNMQAKFQRGGPDLDLFHVGLLSRNGMLEQARELAMQRIPGRKSAAAKGSEPEQRTFYAKCALYYAVASGDLQLYQETLGWAQRFVRDPLVFRELYPQWMASEVCTCLTGIPENYNGLTLATLQSQIQAANAVIEGMFDTACSAIREPSFKSNDWQGVLRLLNRVVQGRIDSSTKLKNKLEATFNDMYKALWDDTVKMLLSVEKKAHRPENKRLNASDQQGPLGCMNDVTTELKAEDIATYKFFDSLAKARDELWQNLRPNTHPSVLTLPSPFPRGLPVQHLTYPWTLDVYIGKSMAPYVAGRAKAALFPDPGEALLGMPEDEETIAAIGSCIDSYDVALSMYIPESCSHQERISRVLEVWNHAIGPLSLERMTGEEAIRFWRYRRPGYLEKEWPPCPVSDGSNATWPIIPEVDDPSQRHEWNPSEAGRPDQPSRKLENFTYLDASLSLSQSRRSSVYIPNNRNKRDPPTVPGNEVDTSQIWNSGRGMGEGGVLSALLYLEMEYGAANGSLLEKAFPSVEDPRYPALYLDAEFQSSHPSAFYAVAQVEDQLDDIPPAILQLAATNMLAKLQTVDLDDNGDVSVQELAMTMILRCAECDRPMLARDLVLRTIFERPKASSWHRILLRPSFLRRLSASDARTVLQSFAEGILKFVESRSAGESSPEKFVKVTTIKQLAQLLNGTEFVDEDYAFSVFAALLTKGTHIDVRLNATKALLSTLDTPSSTPPEAEKVFQILETLIPVAGSLQELKPMSESDWVEAEESLVLPTYPDIDDNSPTMELFVKHHLSAADSMKSIKQGRTFIDRILLPTIASLQRQSSRWMSMFLKKHGIDATEVALPVVPHYATQLLNHEQARHLPRNMLEDLVTYVTFKLTPPAAIEKLNKDLKSKTSDPEVQSWYQLFALGSNNIITFRNLDMLALLDKPTHLDPAVGITPEVIHEQFLEVFKACVSVDAPLYCKLNDNLLSPLLSGTYMTKPWWPSHGKAILSKMIKHVDSLRTPDWQNDPNRKPSVLPDTTPWRLLLLDAPYPSRADTDADTASKCETFAAQLANLVEEIADEMYHIKLDHLKHFLSLDPVSGSENSSTGKRERKIGHWTIYDDKPDFMGNWFVRNRIDVAVELGTIRVDGGVGGDKMPDQMGRAHVLKIVVAEHLLDLVVGQWDEIEAGKKNEVRGMVSEWRSCADEEVRRIGWRLEWVFEKEEE